MLSNCPTGLECRGTAPQGQNSNQQHLCKVDGQAIHNENRKKAKGGIDGWSSGLERGKRKLPRYPAILEFEKTTSQGQAVPSLPCQGTAIVQSKAKVQLNAWVPARGGDLLTDICCTPVNRLKAERSVLCQGLITPSNFWCPISRKILTDSF